MPNTPNASFIPKQGPVRRVRQTASRQVHLFTVASYVLFASTVSADGGVTLYNRHLNQQLDGEVQKLSAAIGGFNETDMDTVREFNLRLHQAQSRLDKSVSLTSVFGALEDATLKVVEIKELMIKRQDDAQVLVSAKVSTDSFDASLFQRGVYERNPIIKDTTITELTLEPETDEQPASVSFLAKINVPLEEILYNPSGTENPTEVETVDTSVSETQNASSTSATSTNEVQ